MIPPQRLVIASISLGLVTFQKPFLLNNDAFPVLENALCWRKRVLKKPGSALLGRLQRNFDNTASPVNIVLGISPQVINLFTTLGLDVRGQPVLGSITPVVITVGAQTLTDNTGTGVFVISPAGNITFASIDYGTGNITLTFTAGGMFTFSFTGSYYPGLPVMGIEDFEGDTLPTSAIDFPTFVFFDTVYSYQYNGSFFVDNSFYKNTHAPIVWTGLDYQQFYSSNYFRAMFVTNNNPGAQFGKINTITKGTPNTTITTAFVHNLSPNDYVFINEVSGDPNNLLNMQCFKVLNPMPMSFEVDADTSAYSADPTGGVFQYLTRKAPNNNLVSKNSGDGIQWYDGLGGTLGFVNFTPPLDNLSSANTTYLIGARMILPFSNYLLAIGTFEATSSQLLSNVANAYTYCANRIRFCNPIATPFYTQGQSAQDFLLPATIPVVPPFTAQASFKANQSWVSNIRGYGGFIDLDTTQKILSAAVTQGVLVLGLEYEQRRMAYTGVNSKPFALSTINPDYGSAGTHAIVPMDKGILTIGEYGFLTTSSYNSERFDLPIIDQIFQVSAINNGYDRICGSRDFVNEVIHFSYRNPENMNVFPNQTVVYNYRENNFATWFESATTYGDFKIPNLAWSALTKFHWDQWAPATWADLEDNGNYPYASFGTPQGFVMLKWSPDMSANGPSLMVQAITGNVITSTNHNLESDMYLAVWPDPNTVPSQIGVVTVMDNNTFSLSSITGIVPGISLLSIVDYMNVQTKQFNIGWEGNRKTRIGAQKYFLDTTTTGEFTAQILGSQSVSPLNVNIDDTLPALISNAIVRTAPDDSLGLNDNAIAQAQIWHRLASSCIGDTIQLQFIFSDKQMKDPTQSLLPWVLHAIVLDLYPSRTLA